MSYDAFGFFEVVSINLECKSFVERAHRLEPTMPNQILQKVSPNTQRLPLGAVVEKQPSSITPKEVYASGPVWRSAMCPAQSTYNDPSNAHQVVL